MKRLLIVISLLINTNTHILATSGMVTTDADVKHKINFYGMLETHQGQRLKIDNISIDNRLKQIEFPDKPPMHAKPIYKEKSRTYEIVLENNPATAFTKARIDLDESSEIRVPHPKTFWTYKTGNGSSKIRYLEVVVISNNPKKTKRSYLVPENIKMKCDEIDAAGPLERVVPLGAIKSLKIEGHSMRNDKMSKENN